MSACGDVRLRMRRQTGPHHRFGSGRHEDRLRRLWARVGTAGVPFSLTVAAILGGLFVGASLWRRLRRSAPDGCARRLSRGSRQPFFRSHREVNVTAYSADITVLVGYLAFLLAACWCGRRGGRPLFMEAAATSPSSPLRELWPDLSPAAPTLLLYRPSAPARIPVSRGRPEEASLRRSAGISRAA
jgi:hypothetical protein